MTWYLYIAECKNGELYTGITSNLSNRLDRHQMGRGGRFTKGHQLMRIIYQESFRDRTFASKREQQIKKWSKTKKLALSSGNLIKLRELSVSRD